MCPYIVRESIGLAAGTKCGNSIDGRRASCESSWFASRADGLIADGIRHSLYSNPITYLAISRPRKRLPDISPLNALASPEIYIYIYAERAGERKLPSTRSRVDYIPMPLVDACIRIYILDSQYSGYLWLRYSTERAYFILANIVFAGNRSLLKLDLTGSFIARKRGLA